MIYLKLFFEFFKTGLFAVGGGLATLPFLYEISDNTGWFTHAQLADMVAVSESTPGPIGVNMATYVGYSVQGIPGAVVATFGLVLPSVIIILIIASFLKKFKNSPWVKSVFYALRPASTAFIANACIAVAMISVLTLDTFKQTHVFWDLFDLKALILAAVNLFLTHIKKLGKLHPVFYLAASAVIGIVFRFAGA
jgi:chromate transporter